MNEGAHLGKSTICLKAAVLKDSQTAFTFTFLHPFVFCLWRGNADLKLELNIRNILNVGSIVHINSVLGKVL